MFSSVTTFFSSPSISNPPEVKNYVATDPLSVVPLDILRVILTNASIYSFIPLSLTSWTLYRRLFVQLEIEHLAPLLRTFRVADFTREFEDTLCLINYVVICGHYQLFVFLINHHLLNSGALKNRFICTASEYGRLDMVKLLLTYDHVDPTVQKNYCIRMATCNGHVDMVKLLLEYEGVDPSAHNNFQIGVASENGNMELVKLLLNCKGVNPAANNNYALRKASEYGHFEVVQLLLTYPDVDPAALQNIAICKASEKGHLEVVKTLLRFPSVRPEAQENYALMSASKNGHVEVVKVLMKYSEVSRERNLALKKALENGHVEVARWLLESRATPTFDVHDEISICNLHVEMVRLLLEYDLSPTMGKLVLCKASERGQANLVFILLESNIHPSFNNNECVRAAYTNCHTDVVDLLVKYGARNPYTPVPLSPNGDQCILL